MKQMKPPPPTMTEVRRIMQARADSVAEGGWKATYEVLGELWFAGRLLVRLGHMARPELIEMIRPLARYVDSERAYCDDPDWSDDGF